MSLIRPITEFRSTNEISDLCYTRNKAMLNEKESDAKIAQAEAEYSVDGKLHDAREALGTLRRKYFG